MSTVQWSKAIEILFKTEERPGWPAALEAKVSLERGFAGVGWYDEDGLAEEIFVGPGPCLRTVHLTLWDPRRCQSLIIRNTGRSPLHVTLVGLK